MRRNPDPTGVPGGVAVCGGGGAMHNGAMHNAQWDVGWSPTVESKAGRVVVAGKIFATNFTNWHEWGKN